jgi:hypothetical protein
MTTLPSAITNNVQGRAVYLEAVHPGGAVTQVLIMPEGLTSAHAIAPLSMYRRRLTVMQPRKTWRHIGSSVSSARAQELNSDNAEIASSMLTFLTPMFDGFVSNGWTIRKEPVFVEVTADDLEDSRQGKTPYKVFGRVWKARKFLGFPKEFIVTEA